MFPTALILVEAILEEEVGEDEGGQYPCSRVVSILALCWLVGDARLIPLAVGDSGLESTCQMRR